jgi:uncharacterized protein YndB with AHSA1/START domain
MDPPQLRYSDCPTAETDVVIAAPPATVWALVSDIELPARFSSEFVGARWLDGSNGPAPGARFSGRNFHPAAGEWETTSIITECEPGRVFGWAVTDVARPSSSWRYTLVPEEGGTRLTMWMRIGPGPSGISPAIAAMPDKESKILHRRLAELRANMEATLAGIRDLAESAAAAQVHEERDE